MGAWQDNGPGRSWRELAAMGKRPTEPRDSEAGHPMRPGRARRRGVAFRQCLYVPLAVIGIIAVIVAPFPTGHGPLDELAENADGELPAVTDVLAAEFTPEGCAEVPSCRAAALMAVAHVTGNATGNAIQKLPGTPFSIETVGLTSGPDRQELEADGISDPPEFLMPADHDAKWWGYLDAAVRVNGTYVGALRYGETGEELFDWVDGQQHEFNPKWDWRINGEVERRFAKAIEDTYRDARRRQVERFEIDSEKVRDALGIRDD